MKKKHPGGRPPLPDGQRRVALSCRVLPETLEALGGQGTRGEVVDEAVRIWTAYNGTMNSGLEWDGKKWGKPRERKGRE